MTLRSVHAAVWGYMTPVIPSIPCYRQWLLMLLYHITSVERRQPVILYVKLSPEVCKGRSQALSLLVCRVFWAFLQIITGFKISC